MKKILASIMAVFLVVAMSGCKDDTKKQSTNLEETKAVSEGDYAALLPYEASTARHSHAILSTNQTETFTVGKGLMELSKKHFDPDTYVYREGQFLTYSALDATSDGEGLLGRTSETNPNGMNPKVGSRFKTDAGEKEITSSDVVLLDIFEMDWYRSNDLEGISLALVLNSKIGDSENPDIITDEMLKTYGEDAARKIVSYLRKTHPEIGQKTPIYVVLYKEGGVNNSLPGVFLDEAYFESKTVGEFKSISEEWALFPSKKASELDGSVATNFSQLKKNILNVLPDATSIIGEGHFTDKKLDSLSMEVSINAKSYAEAYAVVQMVNTSMSMPPDNIQGGLLPLLFCRSQHVPWDWHGQILPALQKKY